MEVVPEDAGLVLQDPHKRRDDRLVVLDYGLGPPLRHREELAQFDESREAPVLLLVREPVVRLCKPENESQKQSATGSEKRNLAEKRD